MPDQAPGGAQPLVVAALLGQVREQVPQVSAGVPDPAGLGGEPEQRLHDRQGDQLHMCEETDQVANEQRHPGNGPTRPETPAVRADGHDDRQADQGRDPETADAEPQGQCRNQRERKAVCLRPLIERSLRPLRAGRVHHVVPHLDDASKAVTEPRPASWLH